MKHASLVAVIGMALCTLGVAPFAAAGCASELTASPSSPILQLPVACRALGPLQLGMTRAQMVAALGQPTQWVTSGIYDGAVYVFPRTVPGIQQKLFKTVIYLHIDAEGVIQVLFDQGRVVSIHVSSPSTPAMPYTVGGIALGQRVDPVLQAAKTSPDWNTHDHAALFVPYPIALRIDPQTRRIRGITIATTTVR